MASHWAAPWSASVPIDGGAWKVSGGDPRIEHSASTGPPMARILIVDDSPSQLLGIKRIVEKLGHEALGADDGAAGVELAKREKPDLILMDVVMPNLNGFQATRTISRDPETAHIPIVMVTTKDQETDKVWGMRQGAKAYVTKPIKEEDLARTLQECLQCLVGAALRLGLGCGRAYRQLHQLVARRRPRHATPFEAQFAP